MLPSEALVPHFSREGSESGQGSITRVTEPSSGVTLAPSPWAWAAAGAAWSQLSCAVVMSTRLCPALRPHRAPWTSGSAATVVTWAPWRQAVSLFAFSQGPQHVVLTEAHAVWSWLWPVSRHPLTDVHARTF